LVGGIFCIQNLRIGREKKKQRLEMDEEKKRINMEVRDVM
jgi:hypothetical protein